MKKFNYKSRKGFTLIELLVVIGILAVLAAIAIPSVAGLIDRANVSADDTNANEMTNAIERFTSEYELVCQDIASGRFNLNNLDSAQSRVHNSTGITDRDSIKALESDGWGGKQINKDTKYPTNFTTTKAIVENYTKTSSATFNPKQSDMNFYYSPDCGVVVFEEASASSTVTDVNLIEKLNDKIISGKDAKGKELDTSTEWINLTMGEDIAEQLGNDNNYIHLNVIPEGGEYLDVSANETYIAGDPFPELGDGDEYKYGDYIYKYNYFYRTDNTSWGYAYPNGNFEEYRNYWGVQPKSRTQTSYGKVLETINEKDIIRYDGLFQNCINLTSLNNDFRFSNKVISANYMFSGCTTLTAIPSNLTLGQSVQSIAYMFSNCTNLSNIPSTFTMPDSVIYIDCLFDSCEKITEIPKYFKIGNSVKDAECVFYNTGLTEVPSYFSIPDSVEDISGMFAECYSLEKVYAFKMGNNLKRCVDLFMSCYALKEIIGDFTFPEGCLEIECLFYDCNTLEKTGKIILPSTTKTIYAMFYNCYALIEIPNNFTIPEYTQNYSLLFGGCTNITGKLIVNATSTDGSSYDMVFYDCYDEITLTGSSPLLNNIKAASSHRNPNKITIT